jgi:hypothetical protein
MAAYTVVGPTKRKPAERSRFASAVDSGVEEGQSEGVRGTSCCSGANDHTSSASGVSSRRARAARAFAIAASILPRCLTIDSSASRRRTSRSPKPATRSGSNPSNAARNPSRLRRIVSQESPDWNPSRQSRS